MRALLRGRVSKSLMVMLLAMLMVVPSTISSIGGANASAATNHSKSKVTVATGSIVCQKVTGTITLSPPDRKGGTKPETMVWTIHASACTTSTSNASHVKSGGLTAVVHEATNACGALVGSQAVHATFTWSPKSVHSTAGTFSGFTFLQNKAGEEGFTLPNTRGTASVTGSFAGKNHGSLSRVTVYTNLTIARFRTVCESKAGLTGYKFISGTAKFS